METLLVIEIKNTEPVALVGFVQAFQALHENYRFNLSRNGVDLGKDESSLYIKELRSGSIIATLTPYVQYALPLLQDINLVSSFIEQTKNCYDWLSGRADKPEIAPSVQELKNYSALNAIVAGDNHGSINFHAMSGGQVVNNFILPPDMIAASNLGILNELKLLKEQSKNFFPRKIMLWRQAEFGHPTTKRGDKAIIESILTKPLRVIFDNDAERRKMMLIPQWHNYAYVVDVEVETQNGVPLCYKIMKVYEDDSFELEADD